MLCEILYGRKTGNDGRSSPVHEASHGGSECCLAAEPERAASYVVRGRKVVHENGNVWRGKLHKDKGKNKDKEQNGLIIRAVRQVAGCACTVI